MKNTFSRKICRISLIAAIYFCLSLFFAPISFGNVQLRVAEALTILPAFSFIAVPGITAGCFLSNLYGAFTGANILGVMDVFFGTLATFLSALLSFLLRKIRFSGLPVLSSLPPVFINAFIIGAELSFVTTGKIFSPVFFIYAVQVSLGQFLSCVVMGLILFKAVKKSKIEF